MDATNGDSAGRSADGGCEPLASAARRTILSANPSVPSETPLAPAYNSLVPSSYASYTIQRKCSCRSGVESG